MDMIGQLPLLDFSVANKEAQINETTAILSPAGRFAMNPLTTTGLTWGYICGRLWANGDTLLANGTLNLPASATSYIEFNGAAIVANQVGFSAGALALYKVTTSTVTVTNYEDRRLAYDGSTKLAEAPTDGNVYGRRNGAWEAISVSALVFINPQTGAAYTLALADRNAVVRMNNAAANTVTIPANSAVAFEIGTQITVRQAGDGQTTIAPAAGVTVNSAATLALRAQHSTVSLLKVGTDEWDLAGDVA
jgi:hypothetical protein